MKTKIKKLLPVLSAALLLWGCGIDCGPVPRPEISSVNAELDGTGDEETGTTASDLRLRVSLDVIYVTQRAFQFPGIGTAYACSVEPPHGFDNEIVTFSLTCNKTVRGFAPGQNILTTNASVVSVENSNMTMTLGQWYGIVNHGDRYQWHDDRYIYDIYISFVPAGTETLPGYYTFKFVLERESGARYEKRFSPVKLL